MRRVFPEHLLTKRLLQQEGGTNQGFFLYVCQLS
jgi:hypothetical protein